ncbi:HAMP domain-containing sensor histidine kinase [Jiulongibacter sediminis]|uniref:histidine kinase n=1 Tax=Jiulongibacter sediminis TaxID=1605367 RepID=A0A0P7BWD5_9BACT|nr:HAMP domain-containing sensor histidine kinase [Jiulongibacter sediminis]KPM48957.1 hypothetical protein AFM12_10440 [Jiulongibacter sediminis]TBX25484.1 hypothetical protein TK44_10445 [Jiulongibacter sediminis]
MRITEKRPLQAGLVVICTMSLFSFIIYRIYERHKISTFFELLEERADLRIAQIKEDKGLISSNFLPLRSEQFAIYNERGQVSYCLDDEPKEIDLPIIQRVATEGRFFLTTDSTQCIYKLTSNNESSLIVYESASDRLGNARLAYLRQLLLIGSILCSLLTYIIMRFVVHQEMQPFLSIIQKMRRINTENLADKLDESEVPNEVGEMAQVFNNLTDRLNKSIKQQKSFISSVSHELRNPLAILQGITEVALLKKREPEDYVLSLHRIGKEISKMTRLINNLLLLSKTQSNPEDIKFEAGRIDEVVWKAKDQLIKQNPQYQILVTFEENPESDHSLILPKMNEDLLVLAFTNLMDNACKYSPDNSVDISIAALNTSLNLLFHNSGPGISVNDLENITKPFFRSSNASRTEGFGLGLSLVSQILSLHDAPFDITSNPEEGTLVTISFPI